jgi:hypothetical protein
VLALFRGTGAELPADPVVGALDKGGHLHCDECGHIRRRRATYVFVREGTLHRVGGDCLERLRLGFAPALAEALSEIEGECAGFRDGEGSEIAGGRAPGLHTDSFLAACACSIRLHGWVSRRQAEGTYLVTTREDACMQIDKRARDLSSDVPTDADRALAGTVREWLRSLDVEAEGFLGSLAVVGRVSYLPTAAQGIAAAAIVAYWRAWAESLPAPASSPYEPVRLTKGKRIVKEIPGSFIAQVQVVRTHTYESAYGLGQVCVFRDLASGHDLVWHTKPQDLRPGQVGELRGTVKGEGLYRGAYQVSVTRCVFFPA